MKRRVLLLMPATTYKASAFLEAADRLELEVVVGTDRHQTLESVVPGQVVALDFRRAERAVGRLLELHDAGPFDAVIGVDDEAALLATLAATAFGLPHNSAASIRAARDKYETRRMLGSAGLRVPRFRRLALDTDPAAAAAEIEFPVVLKPLRLAASRGVLRADEPSGFVRAFESIREILADPEIRRNHGEATHLLVEDFLSGREVSVEGLVSAGRLRVLAIFDKPDPLEGPTFEETIYVTPSRLPPAVRSAIEHEAQAACRALGLVEGPVHIELRIDSEGPWVVEAAPRTIGGLCSRALSFGVGMSLEELVLRHALGLSTLGLIRESRAAGVMMIPIPRRGVLAGVRGVDEARAVPGIEEVKLTQHRGAELLPLPHGNRYLGFIFARSEAAQDVEAALRRAHARLAFEIEAS